MPPAGARLSRSVHEPLCIAAGAKRVAHSPVAPGIKRARVRTRSTGSSLLCTATAAGPRMLSVWSADENKQAAASAPAADASPCFERWTPSSTLQPTKARRLAVSTFGGMLKASACAVRGVCAEAAVHADPGKLCRGRRVTCPWQTSIRALTPGLAGARQQLAGMQGDLKLPPHLPAACGA